jgi:hypothetical protein
VSLFVLPYLSVFSDVVVVAAVLYSRKKLTTEMKILGVYFVLCVLLAVLQLYLAINGINNVWTAQYFSPVQYALLMLAFYYWNRGSTVGKIILYSIPVFVIAWTLGSFWLPNSSDTLNYADPISAVMLVFASSYTLLTIDRLEGTSVLDLPAFWVSAAAIIYFGGTIVFSSLSAPLLKVSIETMRLAWSTQSVANILANLLFAGGFLCLRRKT